MLIYHLSKKFGRLGGGGSDYKPFLQHVGIPAADISFGGGKSKTQLILLIIDVTFFLCLARCNILSSMS